MKQRIGLLHAHIVATSDNRPAVDNYRTDRDASLRQPALASSIAACRNGSRIDFNESGRDRKSRFLDRP